MSQSPPTGGIWNLLFIWSHMLPVSGEDDSQVSGGGRAAMSSSLPWSSGITVLDSLTHLRTRCRFYGSLPVRSQDYVVGVFFVVFFLLRTWNVKLFNGKYRCFWVQKYHFLSVAYIIRSMRVQRGWEGEGAATAVAPHVKLRLPV